MTSEEKAAILRDCMRDGEPIVPPSEGKGLVFKSRHTPGLTTAEDVKLDKGDAITYLKGNGETEDAIVRSGYMRHVNGCYGYECAFASDGQLAFADERRIIDWQGKC